MLHIIRYYSDTSFESDNIRRTQKHALLSRTTWVSWYQKGKTNQDFTEAKNSEWQWQQLGHIQYKCAPSSRQITIPASHHSVFYRPDALSANKPTASKH